MTSRNDHSTITAFPTVGRPTGERGFAAIARDCVSALALATVAATAVACGGGDDAPVESSSPAVARVGDAPISKAEFDRWLRVFAAAQPRSGGPVAVPDPPRFGRCIAALRRQPEVERLGRTSGRRSLGARCRAGYAQLEPQVLAFLIQSEWIEQEAAAQGIRIDDEAVRERFERELGESFPSEAALERHLAGRGQTKEAALRQLRLVELQARLMQRVKARVEVSPREVVRHYRANRLLFDGPLSAVEGSVRRAVRAEHERRALARFRTRIELRQRPRTWCAAGYRVAQCDNAPARVRAGTGRRTSVKPSTALPRGAAQ